MSKLLDVAKTIKVMAIIHLGMESSTTVDDVQSIINLISDEYVVAEPEEFMYVIGTQEEIGKLGDPGSTIVVQTIHKGVISDYSEELCWMLHDGEVNEAHESYGTCVWVNIETEHMLDM